MGLLDVLNGMQNGPRGQTQPAPAGKSGGMSPLMMALLGLLAYKAIKGGGIGNMLGGGSSTPPAPPVPEPHSTGGGLGDVLGGLFGGGSPASHAPAGQPGGLGDILGGALASGGAAGGLGGLLGGLLGGGAPGSALNGGLRNLLQDMEENGHGDVAQSWVGTGPNKTIESDDLANALGSDTIDSLSAQTGMGREELLSGLRQQLPHLVDQLTPDGRVPTDKEASTWI